MRIVKPIVVVEDDLDMLLPNGLKLYEHMARKIEKFVRLCYKSEGRMTEDSWRTFLKGIFQTKRHTGIAEHRMVSVTFVTDRGVSHEGLRHRMAAPYVFEGEGGVEAPHEAGEDSWLQESTRYCDYSGICKKCAGSGDVTDPAAANVNGEQPVMPCPVCSGTGSISKGVTYILPPWIKKAWEMKDGHRIWLEETPELRWGWADYLRRLHENEQIYSDVCKAGEKPEQARYWLPQGLKTEYVASMNLGSWWNFFFKRTPEAAHPQIRQLAIPLHRYFNDRLPQFFDSIPKYEAVDGQFNHKGVWYDEARLVVNGYYDQVEFEEVYSD